MYRKIALLFFLLAPVAIFAQEREEEESEELMITDNSVRDELVEVISDNYFPWERVELNGKLQMDGLPLKPSVKVSMERGKSMKISVRAPFVGEVARIEVDSLSLLAVNKQKKVYAMADVSSLASMGIPLTINDLQDLFLGRIFLLGSGTLSRDDKEKVEVYGNQDSGYAVVPVEQPAMLEGLAYGFETDSYGETTFFTVGTPEDDYYLMADYTPYKKKGRKMELTLGLPDKIMEATLTFDEEKWDAEPMEPLAIDSRYRQVGFSKLLN